MLLGLVCCTWVVVGQFLLIKGSMFFHNEETGSRCVASAQSWVPL